MELQEGRKIIDYIIDQAERYDGHNLKLEQDVISRILDYYDDMTEDILDTTSSYMDIDTTLKYQNLCNKIQVIVERFYSNAYKVLSDNVGTHYGKGYGDFQDLIDIGHEVEAKIQREKVSELIKTPDPQSVDFMKNHAFEQVRNMSNGLLSNMKAKLGEMLVKGVYDKKSIRAELSNILGVNKERAETIAQTEMSMAYNNGAMRRMIEFNKISDGKLMRKYWHGFKYSERTCTYCRPRIGTIYAAEDNTESLPAHPKCRCIWLPFMEGWDKPISTDITRNADMLKRAISPEEIYARINKRMGINYAQYLRTEDALRWLAGDRDGDMTNAFDKAHDIAVKQEMDNFDIATNMTDAKMADEFNNQMRFWKKFVAQNIVNDDTNILKKSYEAIKGVMILPWNATQLKQWDKLLDIINKHL